MKVTAGADEGGTRAAVWGQQRVGHAGLLPCGLGSQEPVHSSGAPSAASLPAPCLPAPISSLQRPHAPIPRFNGILGHTRVPHSGDSGRTVPRGWRLWFGCCCPHVCWGGWLGDGGCWGSTHPTGDPRKRAGWGRWVTYGASSSSRLIPDPGVQLVLRHFAPRAVSHQPAGVGDLGHHPPVLPAGAGGPARQRTGLRRGTCARDPSPRRGEGTQGLGTRGWG